MGRVVSSTKIEPGGSSGGTSAAIDTTGANLIFFPGVQSFSGTMTFSDSAGNTWTSISGHASGDFFFKTMGVYCVNPTTSSSHTFTVGGGSLNQAANIVAVRSAITFDQQNVGVGTSSASTVQPGTITPSGAISAVFTTVGIRGDGITASSIDDGFSIIVQANYASGGPYGLATALVFLNASTAKDPTWTLSGTAAGLASVSYVFSMNPDGAVQAYVFG